MASPSWLRRFGWIAALAVALAVWAVDARARWRILESADAYGRTPTPVSDGGAATGLEFGQRTRLQLSADSYHWTMQAQQSVAEGRLRLRWVDYDNAPQGREVHWSSPLRWWIVAVAWVESALTDEPLSRAIERASGFAGPWLLAGLAVLLTPLVARRFGGAAATLFGLGLVCVAPISSAFAIGTVDHHGLAIVAAMGSVLALAAAPGAPSPRKWIIASGIAGGVGLWISAATQVPMLVGVGLGAAIGTWLGRGQAEAMPAGHWRTWGAAGAVTSLAAYLLEYFPGHLGWRLEVNHPLYALGWLGAGELLSRFARGVRGESFLGRGPERWALLAALGSVCALPTAALCAAEQTFWVSDRLLWSIHAYHIEEFAPLIEEFRRPDGLSAWTVVFLVVTLLPLLALPMGWLVLRRDTPPVPRLALALASVPALLAFALALAQKRWLHVAGALWLGAFVVLVGTVAAGLLAEWRSTGRRGGLVVFAAMVLLPFPVAVARLELALAETGPEVGPSEMRELAARDVARWLRRRTGNDPVIVLSDPTTTTQLVYFGGLRGVGTLYWENLPGLRDAWTAAGINATQAERIVRSRGVTHVVLFSWQRFAEDSAIMFRRDGFLQGFRRGGTPAWLRPLPYRLPSHPYYDQEDVTVYEVAFGQAPADFRLAQVRFRLSRGDPDARAQLASLGQQQADHLPTLCTLAQAFLARRDAAGLDSVWPRILAELRRGAPVEPEDRLVIIQCFLAAGRRSDAAEQLELFWQSSDERALRRLSAGALAGAVRLSADLGVAPPTRSAALAKRLSETSP